MTTQETEARSTEIAERQPSQPMLPLHNGVISPDKWQVFGRMAVRFAGTDFVPSGLRNKPEAVLACLVFGDSLGLHPSTALKEVYVADGKVGISGALMLALIRKAGHKIEWEEVTTTELDKSEFGDGFLGWKCIGTRRDAEGKDEEVDTWTYTMEDAKRANLYPNSSGKAAWMKTPKLMCRWRALAQVARFHFSDVFVGQAVYLPDEAEEASYNSRATRNGVPVEQEERRPDEGPDYGDDPELAAWLLMLFAATNHTEPGRWLPKKIELALKGKTQEQREELAAELVAWLEGAGVIPPERPVPINLDDEHEEVEGMIVDDPGDVIGGDDGEAEGLIVD